MIKYGWIGYKETMANHINYNTKARDTYHPWSGSVIGNTFGFREYNKFLPLKDYLTSPVDVIESILEGVVEGEHKLAETKRKAAELAARRNGGVSDPYQSAMANAKRGDK